MAVRIGMIGPGGMGRAHIQRIHTQVPGGRVIAVTDVDTDNAKSVAAEHSATMFPTAGELITSADVDAVMICSYGPAHAPDVIAAIEAGKPVFCEKPLAPTAAECIAIMEAEQRAGRRLVTVGFMRRFEPSYRQLKAVLDTGQIGNPLIFHSRHRNPTVVPYYTRDMSINDTAIHDIDISRYLLGEEIVSARVDVPRQTRAKADHLQDPLVLILTTRSGVWIDVEIFVNNGHAYDVQGEIVGETGTVRLTDQNLIDHTGSAGRKHALPMDHNQRFGSAFTVELTEWIAAAAAGTHAGPTSWDGYAAACVCDAATRARDTVGTVDVELIDQPALYA